MTERVSDEQMNLAIAEKLEPLSLHYALGPKDWVNDPACTLMLLEKLGQLYDIQIIGMGELWQVRLLGPSPECIEIVVDATPLGRAIANSFCKANGIAL